MLLLNYFKLRWIRLTFILVLILLGLMLLGWLQCSPVLMTQNQGVYQERSIHHPDGIGKFYLGREIAKVMGHEGAAWLERPSRQWEEMPAKLMAALELQPADVVADIGAGTGYMRGCLRSGLS